MTLGSWGRDPVATKELSGLSRRWQTYVARGIYVALFIVVLWKDASQLRSAATWNSSSAIASVARNVFDSFMLLQMALVVLTGISAASDLVTREVRLGTLGLLVCTPLTPWRIAFGKWKAAMAQTGTLILCGLPILGSCAALGGALPSEILCVSFISLAAAGLGAALALLCSSLLRTGTTALIAATGLFVVYLVLPFVLGLAGGYRSDPVFLQLTHLVVALTAALQRPASNPQAWITASAVTFGLILLLLRLTAARIAVLTVRTPSASVLTRAFDALDRFYEGLGPGRIRRLRFFTGSAEVWEHHAILWKELKTRSSGRLRNSVRIALVLLLILSVCFQLELKQLWIPAFATTLIFWFMALANGASLFVKEKEERKWDILLATPLFSGEIITAKLLAGLVPVLPMLATLLYFWGMQWFTSLLEITDLFILALAVGFPALFAYLLGAACSLRAGSLRGAFTIALSGMIALTVFLPWMASEFTGPLHPGTPWFSPITPILRICDEVHRNRHSWFRSSPEPSFLFMILYILSCSGLVTYLYLRFDRITGRSE